MIGFVLAFFMGLGIQEVVTQPNPITVQDCLDQEGTEPEDIQVCVICLSEVIPNANLLCREQCHPTNDPSGLDECFLVIAPGQIANPN